MSDNYVISALDLLLNVTFILNEQKEIFND